jgi:Protein of unknown function (DUF2798)
MTNSAPRSRAKLPARYARIIGFVVLSLFMTCIVSAISTLRSIGFAPNFFSVWPVAWAMSWCVAFPVLMVVQPLVNRIVGALVEGE